MGFLDSIKSIPITDLAKRMGYTLVRKGHYYSLKEHDSVIIDTQKNCFWRNSRFVHGLKGGSGSSIDFFMEFAKEKNCKYAMRQLAQMYGIEGDKSPKMTYQKLESIKAKSKMGNQKETGQVLLPTPNYNNDEVLHYLLKRGISQSVIKYFFIRKMLYEDERKNCVFVSPEKNFACVRSTGEHRFVKDCEGSDYNQCLFFKGKTNAETLYVAESVIDIMSIMTYLQIQEKWYGNYAFLALSGINKIHSLFVHLTQEQQIREVVLCLDRDKGGEEADQKAIQGMKEMNFKGSWIVQKPPSDGFKDWNDYIKSLL